MSSQIGPIVPEGQYPPFEVVTPDDHTAWIIIATALGLAWFLFFGGVRVLVRSTISHGVKMDDYTLYAATILAIIQSSVILGACAKGFGKALDLLSPERQVEVQRMSYTSNLLFVIALGLSKISLVYFLRRISRMKEHQLAFNIAIGIIAAWTVGVLFATALQCNLQQPWITVNEQCSSVFLRLQVICALDIIIEIAIVGLVVYLVYSLQTSMSSKMTVVSIFSFRLFMIIFIVLRLHTFDEAGYTTNPLLLEASYVAWTQAELSYSLISATIPTFQNFLKSLNTGFGGIGAAATGYGYGYGSDLRSALHHDSGRSYQMSKLKSMNKSTAREEVEVDQNGKITHAQTTNDQNLYNGQSVATVASWNRSEGTTQNAETTSIGSDESRRLMIRKEVQWSVRTETKP